MKPDSQEPTRLVHDVLGTGGRPLDAIFAPRAIAVIGATEKAGSVGRTILWNLVGSPFGGTVVPVNPHRSSVLGIKAYPSISALPDQVDLAVIVTPAPSVPDLIGACVEANVRGAVIISASFRETGPEGMKLEQHVLEQARRGREKLGVIASGKLEKGRRDSNSETFHRNPAG